MMVLALMLPALLLHLFLMFLVGLVALLLFLAVFLVILMVVMLSVIIVEIIAETVLHTAIRMDCAATGHYASQHPGKRHAQKPQHSPALQSVKYLHNGIWIRVVC